MFAGACAYATKGTKAFVTTKIAKSTKPKTRKEPAFMAA
jgi:hypothetical protein